MTIAINHTGLNKDNFNEAINTLFKIGNISTLISTSTNILFSGDKLHIT